MARGAALVIGGGVIGVCSAYYLAREGLEVIEVWRGLRPCTPDGLPIIGRPGRFDNLILATGHAMIGVSLGPDRFA